MTAPPSASIGDYELAFLKAGCPAPDLNLAVTLGQGVKIQGAAGGTPVTTQSNQVASANASVGSTVTSGAAPASNAVISTITLTTGYYEIQAVVGFGATAENTTLDNFVLKVNNVAVCNLPVANAANTISQPLKFYVGIVGSQPVTINVGGTAGSAGSIYKSTLIATRQ